MVGAGGQPEALAGGTQERLPAFIQRTDLSDLGGSHVGVAHQLRAGEARSLAISSGLDSLAHERRGLAFRPAGQLVVFDARYLYVQIDPIEQRTADALGVAAHLAGSADAAAYRVAVIAARTRAPRADRHQLAPKGDRGR